MYKNKKPTDELLEHYHSEWSITNQYINDLDKGQAQNIGVFISIATLALSVPAVITEKQSTFDFSFLFFIMPITFLVCFGFFGLSV